MASERKQAFRIGQRGGDSTAFLKKVLGKKAPKAPPAVKSSFAASFPTCSSFVTPEDNRTYAVQSMFSNSSITDWYSSCGVKEIPPQQPGEQVWYTCSPSQGSIYATGDNGYPPVITPSFDCMQSTCPSGYGTSSASFNLTIFGAVMGGIAGLGALACCFFNCRKSKQDEDEPSIQRGAGNGVKKQLLEVRPS